jgi:hypothetical protein
VTRRPMENRREDAGEPYAHPAAAVEATLLAQCTLGKGRAGGPGGQHRNKVETLVEITHEPTGLHAHAGERRSATENRAVAIRRLRLLLATHYRIAVPLGEIGSDLWRSRVRGGKIACNPDHEDYPALLAEAMDAVHAMKHDVRRAAIRLSCTASQLTKLIKDHPPALAEVNRERAERGVHALR